MREVYWWYMEHWRNTSLELGICALDGRSCGQVPANIDHQAEPF